MKRLIFLTLFMAQIPVLAAELNAQVFWYEEMEQGLSPYMQRYLVTDHYMRVDSGQSEDNFILFDATNKIIYSVNHEDKTILTITATSWQLPEFEFGRHQVMDKVKGIPELFGKTVKQYRLFADQEICSDIQLVPDLYKKPREMFKNYQNVLSGQQVQSLFNTPEEMRSPCFLVDQVYNTGEYFDQGLPVQEWHSRGYMKLLKDIQSITVDEKLLTLPDNYQSFYPVRAQ